MFILRLLLVVDVEFDAVEEKVEVAGSVGAKILRES